jgi:hypothetical protein
MSIQGVSRFQTGTSFSPQNRTNAHELTHVVQQGPARPQAVAEKLGVSSLGEAISQLAREGQMKGGNPLGIPDVVHQNTEAMDAMAKLLGSLDDDKPVEAGNSGKVIVRGWDPKKKEAIVGQAVSAVMKSFHEQLIKLLSSSDGSDPSVNTGGQVSNLQKSKHDAAMAAIQNTR